nr:unnamed protein product [Naegleria fowleri]
MGNANNSRRAPIDKALLEPTYQVYSDIGAWELPLLKTLVQSGKLAPFYPPHSELPPNAPNRVSDQDPPQEISLSTSNATTTTTTTTSITATIAHPTKTTTTTEPEKHLFTKTSHHRPSSSQSLLPSPSTTSIESTPSHHHHHSMEIGHDLNGDDIPSTRGGGTQTLPSRRSSSLLWLSKFKRANGSHISTENDHHVTTTATTKTSDDSTTLFGGDSSSSSFQHPPLELYFDECPICMMYYQGGMNSAKCCSQRICSECYLQICRGGPKHAESNSICPFCKASPFKIQYTGPKNWKQRCKELEEEQKVIQLKIKHDQEEQLQQEEERNKRISESLNNSTISTTSTSSTSVVTNVAPTTTTTSLTSTPSTCSNQLQGNVSPSNNSSPQLSGIAFLESYFANRREENSSALPQPSSSSNSTPIHRNPSSTESTSNSDPLFIYLFGNNSSASSFSRFPRNTSNATPTPSMSTNNNNNRSPLHQMTTSDRDDTLSELMRYFSLGRVSTEAAGPIEQSINHSPSRSSSQSPHNNSIRGSSSLQRPSSHVNHSRGETPRSPSRSPPSRAESLSPLSNTDLEQGLPAFSDFIPQTIDVTNVNADDEMLNEAIRLSLLEQQQTQDNFSAPQVIFNRDQPVLSSLSLSPISSSIVVPQTTPSSSTNSSSNATIFTHTISNSASTTLRSPTGLPQQQQVQPPPQQTLQYIDDDEDDAELQLVLRLSILDQ